MNGRPLSPFIKKFFEYKAAMNSRAYNSHLAFLITLKTGAVIPLSTEPLRITSVSKGGESVALNEPLDFIGKILSAPDIQFTQTDANDGSTQMVVSNLDYLLTSLIPESDRLFDGAKVKVYMCFKKSDGTYEGLIYAVGNLAQAEGDHEVAPFSYVSDFSDKSRVAGGRELTQKCLNELGVNVGRSWCGAVVGAGDPPCSKVYDDDEAGCAYYGQQSQFQGVSFFNPNGLVANYGGGILTGGGWTEPENLPCFAPESFYKTPDGYKRGTELKIGDALLNHRGEIAVIQTLEIIWSDYRYHLTTPTGASGIVSASHGVLTAYDDAHGTAIYSLIPTDAQNLSGAIGDNSARILEGQKAAGIAEGDSQRVKIVAEIAGIFQMTEFDLRVAKAGQVLKLGLSAPHIYLAGSEPHKYTGAHNNCPIYNNIILQ